MLELRLRVFSARRGHLRPRAAAAAVRRHARRASKSRQMAKHRSCAFGRRAARHHRLRRRERRGAQRTPLLAKHRAQSPQHLHRRQQLQRVMQIARVRQLQRSQLARAVAPARQCGLRAARRQTAAPARREAAANRASRLAHLLRARLALRQARLGPLRVRLQRGQPRGLRLRGAATRANQRKPTCTTKRVGAQRLARPCGKRGKRRDRQRAAAAVLVRTTAHQPAARKLARTVCARKRWRPPGARRRMTR